VFILSITNESETMEIIKKAIMITPADLKLLLKFNVSLIPIIKDAKIQN